MRQKQNKLVEITIVRGSEWREEGEVKLREGGLLPSKKSVCGGGWSEGITERGLRPSQLYFRNLYE